MYFLGVGMEFKVGTQWATRINRQGRCPLKWVPLPLCPGPPLSGQSTSELHQEGQAGLTPGLLSSLCKGQSSCNYGKV